MEQEIENTTRRIRIAMMKKLPGISISKMEKVGITDAVIRLYFEKGNLFLDFVGKENKYFRIIPIFKLRT